jgi:nucleoside diphosphate kinase
MEKRKTIVIHQENVSPIYLEDDDDRDLEEYTKSLSSFMTLTNISILHTSTASLITRPSKICSMTVHEDNVHKDFSEEVASELVRSEEKQETKEKEVDIITDVD